MQPRCGIGYAFFGHEPSRGLPRGSAWNQRVASPWQITASADGAFGILAEVRSLKSKNRADHALAGANKKTAGNLGFPPCDVPIQRRSAAAA
jgi:hypothetical protein